ncbi:hypothetical protein [Rhodoferax koreensis]|uniref:hypothetical protein n=1 Tax=Rhodoferax koreensis TaxID=1842727 RepID=UPI00194F93C8|nr:hypothetical protein [Rhodoferax koreense]
MGRRELPASVAPSSAGAGRGSVSPPVAGEAPVPSRAERIAAMDAETDPSNPAYMPITENAQNAVRADARGLGDAKRTRYPGRVLDRDIPAVTAGGAARDAVAGALQIGPTAVKGVGDLARLATGDRFGKGISDFAEAGNKAIQEVVGSDRAAAQRTRFEQDMADPALNPADVIVGNPGALADQVLPNVGSMALPAGSAMAAGKLAQASKAAQLAKVIDEGTVLARAERAREAATIGTTVLQNAADTYGTVRDAGGDQGQAYLAAGITAPATYVAGRLTGGGAEGEIARAMGSKSVAHGVREIGKGMAKEGAQEVGEEAGQYLGETVGKGDAFDAGAAGKRLAVAGTLGAVMGGGVDATIQARDFAAAALRIKRLRDAGEDGPADLLQGKLDRQQAAAAVDTELAGMAPHTEFAQQPGFQADYRQHRIDGVKPVEAAGRSALTSGFRAAAGDANVPADAVDAALAAARDMPIDKVPSFFQKFTQRLAAKGVIAPVQNAEGLGALLAEARDVAMDAAMESVYKPDDVRGTMNAVQELENAGNPAGDAEIGPSDAGNAASETPIANLDPVRPEIEAAAHEAATSPLNDLPEPTPAQKEAGNYRKGHINVHGMDVAIENPKGSERRGVSPDGTEWANTMGGHYGYIKGTVGADKDHVDTYIGHNPDSNRVFVIDQVNKDGSFDEHKVMMGYDTPEQAREAYMSSFMPGWTGLGAMTELPVSAFKSWVHDGAKKKPLGTLDVPAKAAPAEAAPDPGTPAPANVPADVPSAPVGPVGRDGTALADGGKPFKTRRAAGDARKLQPHLRVVSVDGGFALDEKTPAQLAAEEKAARRLRTGGASEAGMPIPAHAFIADQGGLAKSVMADAGFDRNVRVRSKWLFAGAGKGLTLEQATGTLAAAGYLRADASQNDALALIRKSLTEPQYTPEGWERIAEAEQEARRLQALDDADPDVQQAAADLAEASDDFLDRLNDDDIPDIWARGQVMTEADADLLFGVPSEQTADTNTAGPQGLREPVEADAGAAPPGDRPRDGEAGSPREEVSQNPADAGFSVSGATEEDAPTGLTAPTKADILAQQQAKADGDKVAEDAARAADAKAKKATEQREIDARQEASADNFQLGQDPMDSLTGQTSMFDPPPSGDAAEKPAQERADVELRKRLSILKSIRKCLTA